MFTCEAGGLLNHVLHLYHWADHNERDRRREVRGRSCTPLGTLCVLHVYSDCTVMYSDYTVMSVHGTGAGGQTSVGCVGVWLGARV